jgi:imidazolonepropionase
MRILVTNISQLLSMDTGLHDLRSPHASRILGIVDDAALVVEDGLFRWVGPVDELPAALAEGAETVDAGGRVVMPGLVECHTHLLFGGSRAHEFEMRARGASYEEIAEKGGGIASTVRATREAGADALFVAGLERLDRFARYGVTTVEIKSGYGLELETELKLLETARALDGRHPLDVVSTFLGAHIDLVCKEMIPEVARQDLAEFCDVFCEQGAFTVAESRRILETGLKHGLRPKIHSEQLTRGKGTRMAAELAAVSADHLDHAVESDAVALARAGTVAVLLPGATFFLAKSKYPRGRLFIDAGGTVALSTDYNPGSSHTMNLWLMGTLASTHCGLTPPEALWAMTRGAAAAIGRQDRAGAIRVGSPADFLILDPADWQELLYFYGHNPVRATYKAGVRL